jgi:hypothetical protein
MSARWERAVYCIVTARRRSERPTVPPSFDVLQYAKDSEARMKRSAPPPRTAGVPAHIEAPLELELDFDDWLEAAPKTQSEVRLMTHPNSEAPADLEEDGPEKRGDGKAGGG